MKMLKKLTYRDTPATCGQFLQDRPGLRVEPFLRDDDHAVKIFRGMGCKHYGIDAFERLAKAQGEQTDTTFSAQS